MRARAGTEPCLATETVYERSDYLKRNNIIENISIKMMSTSKYVLSEKEIVPDDMIMNSILSVQDIEGTDRDGRTLLINAAFYERKQIVEFLLKRGANVNAKDRNGFTALHAATQTGNLDIASVLLENGTDVNAKNCFGNSPLMTCDHKAPAKIFELLISYGADPLQKNNYGISAVECFSAYPQIMHVIDNSK